MQIELHLVTVPDFPIRAHDENEEDVRSILMDVRDAIGERSEFVVSGFGQDLHRRLTDSHFVDSWRLRQFFESVGINADEKAIEKLLLSIAENRAATVVGTKDIEWSATPGAAGAESRASPIRMPCRSFAFLVQRSRN